MSSIKIDKTIRPGDLVEVNAWAQRYARRNGVEAPCNIAVVTKVANETVFEDDDCIVHVLFIGQSGSSMAMLSRMKKLNS